jgi:beta-glucanase (GH16 family)
MKTSALVAGAALSALATSSALAGSYPMTQEKALGFAPSAVGLPANLQELYYDEHGGALEIAMPLPLLPGVTYHHRSFTRHSRFANGGAEQGHARHLAADLPFGLNLKLGTTHYEDARRDDVFVGLTFTLSGWRASQNRDYGDWRHWTGYPRYGVADSVGGTMLKTAGTLALIGLALSGGGGGGGGSTPNPAPQPPAPGNNGGNNNGGGDNPTSNWSLLWFDEFDGDSLDLTKWNVTDSWGRDQCFGGGNNEAQCYTDSPDNISIVDGNLVLTARPATGLAQGRSYTSGRVQSSGKGDWTYGKFEIRAKLPTGQGTWPAVWMLPTDLIYGGWAASGEIDIVETVNLGASGCGSCDNGIEDRAHGTIHFGGAWPGQARTGGSTHLDDIDAFHTYTLEWYRDEMRWLIDGEEYLRRTNTQWRSNAVPSNAYAPFDQRFHLILNLAIGGDWPTGANEGGIDPTGFPKQMLVDYVRVYECEDDADTAIACRGN